MASPFQLLELNLISAQDIAKVSRSMRSYAVAWVHPDRKLTTRVDTHGGTNPTWNDKFVFRVDNQFLQSDTSAIMIEIYALHWFKDVHVGTVRVLVGNLIPPQTRSHNQNHIGMRFVALQVRRPSGRPQGILNVGVTVLDSTMRSMPLYRQLSTSAVGYQKFLGQEEAHGQRPGDSIMAELRRSKSERSSTLAGQDDQRSDFILPKPNDSIINGANMTTMDAKKDKPVYDKPLSVVDGASNLSLAMKLKAQEAKADSVLSYGGSSMKRGGGARRMRKGNRSDVGAVPPLLRKDYKSNSKAGSDVGGIKQNSKTKHNWLPQSADNQISKKLNEDDTHYHKGYPIAKDFAAGSVWSESEVGPSPSEVAAAIAEDSKYRKFDEGGSSILDDYNESEGVNTKLERWRTQMPPPYDYSRSDSGSTMFPTAKHKRRHTDGGGGKFSCFSNICGLECTIVCGKGGNSNTKTKKAGNKHAAHRAPSMDSVSTYF